MPEGRGRPADRRSKETQAKEPDMSREPVHRHLPRVITAWSVFVAIGSVGGSLSLFYNGWDFFVLKTEPEIRAAAFAATDPFSLPFSIRNPSSVFDMYEAQWSCVNDDVNKGGVKIIGGIITTGNKTTIAHNTTVLALCEIPRINLPPNTVGQSTITAIINYKTMGIFSRQNGGFSFTWLPNVQPPHWEPGKFLK